MLYKPSSKDETSLDASFLKSLSTTKCVIALANNNLFVGFYAVIPHKCIHPIFQPQHCTLTNPDTGIEQFLVWHGSNNPRFFCIPIKVVNMFICLVDTSSTEVPACYRLGPALTAANIMSMTTLDLQDGTFYRAVHLPLALPIPFGIDDTTKGTLTKSSMDIIDTTVKNGTF